MPIIHRDAFLSQCLRSTFVIFLGVICFTQNLEARQHHKHHKIKPTIRGYIGKPGMMFRPTFNLDSASVGSYFYPTNVSASWTIRRISELIDSSSKVQYSDTGFTTERVISVTAKTLQGLPYIVTESKFSRAHEELSLDTSHPVREAYYVDDSVIMAVFNNSVNNGENRILLVNPLKVGAQWHDKYGDSVISQILSLHEPVQTPAGLYTALVVSSRLGVGELNKYFVRGVGIVKTVFRGIPPNGTGTVLVTQELMTFETGDLTKNLRKSVADSGKTAGQGNLKHP